MPLLKAAGFTPKQKIWDNDKYIDDKNFDYGELTPIDYSAEFTTPFCVPKGTILVVDRVYIRRGLRDFSSLTFRTKSSPQKELNKKGIKFWAKLSDVNRISYVLVEDKAIQYES